MKTIEITGNWREAAEFLPCLQTHEPPVADGTIKRFSQTLRLPPGLCNVRFLYEAAYDNGRGAALGKVFTGFNGLSINGRQQLLTFVAGESGEILNANTEFMVAEERPIVEIQLNWGHSRPPRVWVTPSAALPAVEGLRAIPPPDGKGEFLMAHGIPFLARQLDISWDPAGFSGDHQWKHKERGTLQPWKEGMVLPCGGARVNAVYFLGMIHSIDIANGSWYSRKGDHGYSHFVGDKAGEIVVHWSEGGTTAIPLVFGFNLWYGRPWDIIWHNAPYSPAEGYRCKNADAELFGGAEAPRQTIHEGLALVDGLRTMGSRSCNARYVFAVDLGGRAVREIQVKGSPDLYGHPLISAVTLRTVSEDTSLCPLPALSREESNLEPLPLDAVRPEAFQARVAAIQRLLYAFIDELPVLREPEIPGGYFGPRYDFQGPREATYAASYLYRNGPECAAYLADSGTGCSSSTARKALFHYTEGAGFWRTEVPAFGSLDNWLKLYAERKPGELPGRGSAWARGIGELLRESMALGYDKFVDSYLDWLDTRLFLDGTPPHWVRTPGNPEHARQVRQVGDCREEGNRENDGHGICMWGRYMMWHWEGRPVSWNDDRRWKATEASANWIQWQLDTEPIFPDRGKEVLYTESECAHGNYDIYSSYNCLHGLKLAIRMAAQLGRTNAVARWQPVYMRLRAGILRDLVDASPVGPIWHTEANCDWQDHAHKLVHLQLATEGDTYTPLQDDAQGDDTERRYLEISRNSYRFLMREKNYDCLRMYGYGQGMMLQSALLLDEMADAEQFLNLMVTYCYLPQLEGWAGPEGIIVHRSGKYYLPVNGYMGQDSHVADSVKALRVMLGVDDNDPRRLRLVPRFPATWRRMAIADYPVLTGTQRQKCRYVYAREAARHTFEYAFENAVLSLRVRLGPLSPGTKVGRARWNNDETPAEVLDSGDSRWVWVATTSAGKAGVVSLEIQS